MTTTPSREDWEDIEKLSELEDRFRIILKQYDVNSYILTEYFHEFSVYLREYGRHLLQSHNNALVAEIEKLKEQRNEIYKMTVEHFSNEQEKVSFFKKFVDIIRIIQEK